MPPSVKARRAFTLIELLVVIAIIAERSSHFRNDSAVGGVKSDPSPQE
jgi:prepilin-type N-terminal cleavage/methylation domain-containing protein